MLLWIILALGSAIFHAIGAIINKKVLEHEHALEYGALKGTFGLLLIFALPFIELNYSLGTYLVIFGNSVIILFGGLYFFKSIRHGELSAMAPLMNLSPLFLLVIAYVLLGEQVKGLALIGIFLLIAGTYFLQMAASKSRNFFAPFKTIIDSKYSLFMIFAMVIYSLAATLEKGLLNNGIHAISLLVLLRLMISINYLIFDYIKYGKDNLFDDIKKDGKFAFAGSLADLGNLACQYTALAIPGVMVSLVIPIKRLSTLFVTLAGGRMFHEKHLGVKILACVIMLLGISLIAFS